MESTTFQPSVYPSKAISSYVPVDKPNCDIRELFQNIVKMSNQLTNNIVYVANLLSIDLKDMSNKDIKTDGEGISNVNMNPENGNMHFEEKVLKNDKRKVHSGLKIKCRNLEALIDRDNTKECQNKNDTKDNIENEYDSSVEQTDNQQNTKTIIIKNWTTNNTNIWETKANGIIDDTTEKAKDNKIILLQKEIPHNDFLNSIEDKKPVQLKSEKLSEDKNEIKMEPSLSVSPNSEPKVPPIKTPEYIEDELNIFDVDTEQNPLQDKFESYLKAEEINNSNCFVKKELDSGHNSSPIKGSSAVQINPVPFLSPLKSPKKQQMDSNLDSRRIEIENNKNKSRQINPVESPANVPLFIPRTVPDSIFVMSSAPVPFLSPLRSPKRKKSEIEEGEIESENENEVGELEFESQQIRRVHFTGAGEGFTKVLHGKDIPKGVKNYLHGKQAKKYEEKEMKTESLTEKINSLIQNQEKPVWKENSCNDCMVKLKNIPINLANSDIKDVFLKFGKIKRFVRIMPNICSFSSDNLPSIANHLIRRGKCRIKGQKIKIRIIHNNCQK